jgi:hypothetical protein
MPRTDKDRYRLTRVTGGRCDDFDFGPTVEDERSRELTEQTYRHTTDDPLRGRELVECREHDDSDDLQLAARRCRGCERGPTCRRVHRILVALVKIGAGTPDETWTVRHADRRASHTTASRRETEQHRVNKEGYCTASTAAGYEANVEAKLRGDDRHSPKPDVLVIGSVGRFAYEVQRGHHSIPTARGRVTKIRKYGAEPVFSTFAPTLWSDKYAIPHLRTNDLREVRSAPDDWSIAGGLRRIDCIEPCEPRYGRVCLTLGPGKWCRGKHPRLEPLPGMRVWEFCERFPAGDLVAVRYPLPSGAVAEYIVSAADRDRLLDAGAVLLNPATLPAEDKTPQPVTDSWTPRPGFGDVLDRRREGRHPVTLLRRCTRCREAGVRLDRFGNCETCVDELRATHEDISRLISGEPPTPARPVRPAYAGWTREQFKAYGRHLFHRVRGERGA